jgi:hypothetical protein
MVRLPSSLRLVLALCSVGLTLSGCGSDAAESSTSRVDAAADATEPDAGVDDAAEEAAPPDAPPDAIEAGPTDCTESCATSCEQHTPVEGACATCTETVCSEYKQRAETAPNRDQFFDCLDACGTEAGCPDDCCNQFANACAFEMAYEYCTCGFPQEDCSASCADTCSTAGLTQSCGICGSQSPCTLSVFDYLFAADRYAHQDCVDTCMSSSLTLDECLDRCRDDYPVPGEKYDGFLACVCAS